LYSFTIYLKGLFVIFTLFYFWEKPLFIEFLNPEGKNIILNIQT